MDSPGTTTIPVVANGSGSTVASNDETPRVKFLCSFLGSILPRPQDGKLRYVGGETRIVSVPRDISFEELMNRMRELYEGAAVLKYQQPDEDLDALVSVVNDDDVTNMMEEYEKLGSADGFTRLRIFLFSHPDQDGPTPFDGDDRESERRYVDALNNLNDGVESFRKPYAQSPAIAPLDDMTMPPYNMHHLAVPQIGSGHIPTPVTQRLSDVEGTWSPAYFSPRHHGGHHDPRANDYPSSPSSAHFRMPFGEKPDKPEELSRHQLNHYPSYEHQPQPQPHFPENNMWMPTDKTGFPGNLLHNPNIFEGSSACEHRRVPFHRNQSHLEPNLGNALPQAPNFCAECPPNREVFMMNADSRTNVPNTGRLNDLYLSGHGPSVDSHLLPPTYVHHRTGPELGNEVLHDQTMDMRYANIPYAYGAENAYPMSHGHGPGQPMWRNAQSPMHTGPAYELPSGTHLMNGSVNPAYVRVAVDGHSRFGVGVDNRNPWAESSQKFFGNDVVVGPEYSYGPPTVKLSPIVHVQDNLHSFTLETSQPQQSMPSFSTLHPSASFSNLNLDKLPPLNISSKNPELRSNIDLNEAVGRRSRSSSVERNKKSIGSGDVNSLKLLIDNGATVKADAEDPTGSPKNPKLSIENLSFVPELIASVKKAAVEEAEEVKAKVKEDSVSGKPHSKADMAITNEPALTNANGEDLEPDNDSVDISKIEPTKAEAEAISRGLQTIKNDDLEQIRELGSGTYGAVYHGKWKGSDVAIKRIKASCFAGRPSERERLIADFWKEALILGSLHHPNVVSFYGIVRDGPDGSLATVTEFMVNGSLKTIDRRKRLIIAMDAAFGMEYLHGKNIVHFDLKCENLLVNMRDPQRPVCKIGDLGLSKVKQHTMVSGGVRGTLPWMAPELLSGKTSMVTEKIDVYSFGIVMWELLTGEEPYADMHCASIIGGIVNDSLRPQIPSWCDPEWKSLMESCWASNPSQRPSFAEISQKLRNIGAAMNLK
ncbi:hypothetical protein ACFE04_008210 [Oxalis oulophora]